MIEVESIGRRYGELVAVEDVSFSVARGEILGLLGPNGAGKTTTMRILCGVLGPTRGSARVAGFDVQRQGLQARRRLGYLPEQPPLYPSMTVRGFVDHAARLRRVPGGQRCGAVDEALERAGLGAVAGRLIAHLSKGYRQRVGLAQALVHRPPVLVLDEPTSGLDPGQMSEVRELIGELRGDHTVILSTHLLSEVTASCDRVLILAQGRVVAQGTEAELQEQLATDHRVRLQLARPDEQTAASLAEVPGVLAVEPAPGGFDVRCEPHAREALNAAAQAWGLLESRSAGIEELYLRAVTAGGRP